MQTVKKTKNNMILTVQLLPANFSVTCVVVVVENTTTWCQKLAVCHLAVDYIGIIVVTTEGITEVMQDGCSGKTEIHIALQIGVVTFSILVEKSGNEI